MPPGQGFAVGSTTNACTKGLWIHTQPLQLARKRADGTEEKEYTNVLIIDTEGLAAFNANDSHDAKIFALALLLCSYFIYNSTGKIDEDAIGKLSLVCKVCQQVRANAVANDRGVPDRAKKRRRTTETTNESGNNSNRDNDSSDNNNNNNSGRSSSSSSSSAAEKNANSLNNAAELAEFFPHFLWLLRDFSLLLQDEHGRDITSRQYLENALADKQHSVGGDASDDDEFRQQLRQSIAEKNHLRRMLRKVFVHRDCETLMRPCIDEAQLQKMDQLDDSALRPEFVAQLKQLRRKVLFDAPHKMALGGRPVSGRGLVQLCRSYVDAFNRGAAPVIRDSWNMLVEVQCRDAIDAAKTMFTSTLATLFQQHCRPQSHSLTRVQLDQAVRSIVDGDGSGGGEEKETFRLQLLPQTLEQIFERATARALEHYATLCGGGGGDGHENIANDTSGGGGGGGNTFRARLEQELQIMAGRVRAHNARGLEQQILRIVQDVERTVLPKLQLQAEQQFASAQTDASILPTLRFRELWQQYTVLVEEAVHDQLTLDSTDAIIQSIVQRECVARHRHWAQAIEQHWLSLLKRVCESIGAANKYTQEALQEARASADTARQRCEKAQQDLKQLEAELDNERQIGAKQREAYDAALRQHDEMHAEKMLALESESKAILLQLEQCQVEIESNSVAWDVQKSEMQTETEKLRVQYETAKHDCGDAESRCTKLSNSIDQMHEENEAMRERLHVAEQTASKLRSCEVDLQEVRGELSRVSADYGAQLAQLERDSVASLAKIRATNERTRREQTERCAELQQQYDQLLASSSEMRQSLETQLASLSDKWVAHKKDALEAAERATAELQACRERIVAAEQALLDSEGQHQRAQQDLVARYEQKLQQAAQMARDDNQRTASEKAALQKQLNEATTEAACLRVRNEHLQSKVQDEANRGELQQAKKDFERAAQLNDKLRGDNEKLLAQQRAHQHELQERERRIEQMQKKMQEQEREFSAERLRLRLRFEEEAAQKAYSKSLNNNSNNLVAKKDD